MGIQPPVLQIGFEPGRLTDIGAARGFAPVKVSYDPGFQRHAMEALVRSFLDTRRTHQDLDADIATFVAQFAALAPAIKNYAFREEREWRLFSQPLSSTSGSTWGYHQSGSLIVPHARLPLGPVEQSPICAVQVGPCPHPSLVMNSVGMLARQCGLNITVAASAVPFRNW